MKTQAAQAAALIRKEIKAAYPGLKFRCTSKNYSMGSSVNVYLEDQPKEVYDAITTLAKKYQYGHFDGMNDIYEYSNSRDDIPQAKHVFVKNEMTEAKKQEVWTKVRDYWSGGDELPEAYEAARNMPFHGTYVSQFVWQQFARGEA